MSEKPRTDKRLLHKTYAAILLIHPALYLIISLYRGKGFSGGIQYYFDHGVSSTFFIIMFYGFVMAGTELQGLRESPEPQTPLSRLKAIWVWVTVAIASFVLSCVFHLVKEPTLLDAAIEISLFTLIFFPITVALLMLELWSGHSVLEKTLTALHFTHRKG
ncbi:MAG: hypothetical protein AB1757_24610 [Acidobacteriota bacterium]